MKDNKSFLIGSILSVGALVLLKPFISNECGKCPVHTKPEMKWIMNPCINCKLHGRNKHMQTLPD